MQTIVQLLRLQFLLIKFNLFREHANNLNGFSDEKRDNKLNSDKTSCLIPHQGSTSTEFPQQQSTSFMRPAKTNQIFDFSFNLLNFFKHILKLQSAQTRKI